MQRSADNKNLGAHLLTHSQERSFVCTLYQARFRELQDLKSHTKLYTGERPHVCNHCGRRFACEDALARHQKGFGGCAGREMFEIIPERSPEADAFSSGQTTSHSDLFSGGIWT
jgi:hypothetical protein